MKRSCVVAMLVACFSTTNAQYHENTKEWRVVPEIMVVHYLPGYEFHADSYSLFGNGYGSSTSTYQYSGFGGEVSVRFMNLHVPGLALTLSGGAVSYYKPSEGYAIADAAPSSSPGNDRREHIGGRSKSRRLLRVPRFPRPPGNLAV